MKYAAERLEEMPQVGRELAVAQAYYQHIPQQQLPGVSMEDLMAAWQEVLKRASHFSHHKVGREELSVREHMSMILRRLNAEPLLEFSALFDLREGVQKMVVCFLAILELAREGLVRLTQQQAFSPIYLQTCDVLS